MDSFRIHLQSHLSGTGIFGFGGIGTFLSLFCMPGWPGTEDGLELLNNLFFQLCTWPGLLYVVPRIQPKAL